MNVAELKTGMNNVNLTAKVVEISEPRQVTTKFGTQTTLTNATLEDETGKITLTLWGLQSDNIAEGIDVEITNGFVKEFRGNLQLGIGKGGSIKPVI